MLLLNGIIKNWIDWMAFNCHRPAFAGKTAYIVTTSGAGSSNHDINTLKNAFTTWGINFVGSKKFRTGALMDPIKLKTIYDSESKKAAAALFDGVNDSSKLKPSFYSLIAFKIQQLSWQKADRPHDTVDYKYWKDCCNVFNMVK